MLRFYLRWDGQNYVVMNDTFENIGKVWRRTQCDSLTTQFVEMIVRRTEFGFETTFLPLDVESISGVAIKAVNDHNQNELRKRIEKTNDMNEFKYSLQFLIDMKCAYGEEFMKEFESMLLDMKVKFPVSNKKPKTGTLIIG